MRTVVGWVCHAQHGVGTHKSCPFRRYFLYTQEKTQNEILGAHPYLKWTKYLTKMGDRSSVGESVGHPDQELLEEITQRPRNVQFPSQIPNSLMSLIQASRSEFVILETIGS